jgi:hypothetical protein
MSIEAQILIKATFLDDNEAKLASQKLDDSLKATELELATALDSLNSIPNIKEYEREALYVDDLARQKSILSISAYSYTSENPIWFAESLYELGAIRLHIQAHWDGHVRNYCFVNGKRVQKKSRKDDKTKVTLSEKDIEINKRLFLPEGRVPIKAELVKRWDVCDLYESVMMEFITEDGDKFYHKSTGKLKELSYKNIAFLYEFTAVFERGKHKGEYVSFAKRPTKIKYSRINKKRKSRLP